MYISKHLDNNVANILNGGGIGIMPTDTVYGIITQASNETSVERLYKLRGRSPSKPCIILISDPKDMKNFGVSDDNIVQAKPYWPAPITLIFPVTDQPGYLTRGKEGLAFRMPEKTALRKLIRQTGPLIAPSANPEGEPTAKTIVEAKKYFSDRVDFYIGDNKAINANPSTILDMSSATSRQMR